MTKVNDFYSMTKENFPELKSGMVVKYASGTVGLVIDILGQLRIISKGTNVEVKYLLERGDFVGRIVQVGTFLNSGLVWLSNLSNENNITWIWESNSYKE